MSPLEPCPNCKNMVDIEDDQCPICNTPFNTVDEEAKQEEDKTIYLDRLKTLESEIETIGESPTHHYQRGVILEELGRLAEALEAYEKATVMDTEMAEAWFRKGVVNLAMGNAAKAVENFEIVTEINPAERRAWFNIADAYEKMGKKDLAREWYTKALKFKPSEVTIKRKKVCAICGKEIPPTEEICVDCLQMGGHAAIMRGEGSGTRKGPDRSIDDAAMDLISSFAPDAGGKVPEQQQPKQAEDGPSGFSDLPPPDNLISTREETTPQQHQPEQPQPVQHQPEERREQITDTPEEIAPESDPPSPIETTVDGGSVDPSAVEEPQHPQEEVKNEHFENGLALKKEGNYLDALSSFEKAIEDQPERADIWLEKARLLSELGEFPKACKAYKELIQRQKDHHDYWLEYGQCFELSNEHAQAISVYTEALQIFPNDERLILEKANCHKYLKDFDKAQEEYRKLLEKDPNHEKAILGIGDTYLSSGEPGKALRQYFECYEKNPEGAVKTRMPAITTALGRLGEWIKNQKKTIKDAGVEPSELSTMTQSAIMKLKEQDKEMGMSKIKSILADLARLPEKETEEASAPPSGGEEDLQERAQESIAGAAIIIRSTEEREVDVSSAQNLLDEAQRFMAEGDYHQADLMAKEAWETASSLERNFLRDRCIYELKMTRSLLVNVGRSGVDVTGEKTDFKGCEPMFKEGRYQEVLELLDRIRISLETRSSDVASPQEVPKKPDALKTPVRSKVKKAETDQPEASSNKPPKSKKKLSEEARIQNASLAIEITQIIIDRGKAARDRMSLDMDKRLEGARDRFKNAQYREAYDISQGIQKEIRKTSKSRYHQEAVGLVTRKTVDLLNRARENGVPVELLDEKMAKVANLEKKRSYMKAMVNAKKVERDLAQLSLSHYSKNAPRLQNEFQMRIESVPMPPDMESKFRSRFEDIQSNLVENRFEDAYIKARRGIAEFDEISAPMVQSQAETKLQTLQDEIKTAAEEELDTKNADILFEKVKVSMTEEKYLDALDCINEALDDIQKHRDEMMERAREEIREVDGMIHAAEMDGSDVTPFEGLMENMKEFFKDGKYHKVFPSGTEIRSLIEATAIEKPPSQDDEPPEEPSKTQGPYGTGKYMDFGIQGTYTREKGPSMMDEYKAQTIKQDAKLDKAKDLLKQAKTLLKGDDTEGEDQHEGDGDPSKRTDGPAEGKPDEDGQTGSEDGSGPDGTFTPTDIEPIPANGQETPQDDMSNAMVTTAKAILESSRLMVENVKSLNKDVSAAEDFLKRAVESLEKDDYDLVDEFSNKAMEELEIIMNKASEQEFPMAELEDLSHPPDAEEQSIQQHLDMTQDLISKAIGLGMNAKDARSELNFAKVNLRAEDLEKSRDYAHKARLTTLELISEK